MDDFQKKCANSVLAGAMFVTPVVGSVQLFCSADDLCRQVREIKPRFSASDIKRSIADLAQKGFLQALQDETQPSA